MGNNAGLAGVVREMSSLLSQDEISNVSLPATEGWCLPPRCFTSQDFFEAEVQRIFMRDWVCIGRADRVENPGDYFTLAIAGEPLLISRDDAGAIRAFSNVCPHRGSVMIEGQGNAKIFSCPYHGWRFSRDGKLAGAPLMDQTIGFDKANCRLREIGIEVWGGFAFINFDRNASPLAPRLAGLEKKIARYRFNDFKTDQVAELENECNWKIGVENAIDEYHAYIVHRSLEPTKSFYLDKTFAEADPDGMWAINMTPAIKPYPYVTGTSLAASPFPAIEGLNDFEMKSFNVLGIFPNTIIALNPDSIITLIFFPISPGKTALHVAMNYPRSSFGIADFERHSKEAMEALIFTNDQDMYGCRLAQKGLYSSLAQPGRLSYLEEAVRYFDSYIARRMARYVHQH